MENGLRQRFLNGSEEEKPEENLKVKVYDESKKIWRVALPGILSRVASFGSIVVTQSFVGHISELDLAAYALVQTLTVRFVNGILFRAVVQCGSSLASRVYEECRGCDICLLYLGIWIGMICGVVTQSAALCYMTWRTDWDEEVFKAQQRLKRWYMKSSEVTHQNPELV
nr:protein DETOXIFICATION 24-like [Ipomoea batatas]GMD43081.1 protein DETOXIFICATION 24-like [Ipomoea batatas]GMD46489.1 protein DETOXIFICATION 24-like [Ipomoea batatas]GMD48051.1 protein DETOXIFICATION 24-like [Ipomoea batatas]